MKVSTSNVPYIYRCTKVHTETIKQQQFYKAHYTIVSLFPIAKLVLIESTGFKLPGKFVVTFCTEALKMLPNLCLRFLTKYMEMYNFYNFFVKIRAP